MMLGPQWRGLPAAWSLDGEVFAVRVPAAMDFAAAVMASRANPIVLVLECTEPSDRSGIAAAVASGRLTDQLVDEIADRLVEALTGMRRWEADYLWQVSLSQWRSLDGELLLSGVDVSGLPPDRAVNVLWSWWRRRITDRDSWAKFEKELTREPRRVLRAMAGKPLPAPDLGDFSALMGAP